jgi:hypothetical protein
MLSPDVSPSRTNQLTLAALIGALALLLGPAIAPRAAAFATGGTNVVGGDPTEALAQLYRQDARVLRVLGRPAPTVDLTRILRSAVGGDLAPGPLGPCAPWDVVTTDGPAFRSFLVLAARSCRGPPAA